MREMKREIPNPTGSKGKPILLADHKFEDVVRRMLATPTPPKAAMPTKKRPTKEQDR